MKGEGDRTYQGRRQVIEEIVVRRGTQEVTGNIRREQSTGSSPGLGNQFYLKQAYACHLVLKCMETELRGTFTHGGK